MESGEATAPKLAYTNRYVTSLEIPTAEVELGCLPTLPDTVQVTYSDGETAQLPVEWDSMTHSMFSQPGTVYVSGTASGLYLPVTAQVTVKSAPADKAHLNDVIRQAQALDENAYTDASWKVLADALAQALAVQADADAAQQQVDDAAAALEKAIAQLEKVPGPNPDPDPTPTPEPTPGTDPAQPDGSLPATDDVSAPVVWMALLALSAAGYTLLRKRRS